MAKEDTSNVDRLRDAGIIKPKTKLTPEQTAAIESLSKKQVDQVIAVNKQLDNAVSSYSPIIVMPGIIGQKPGKGGKP
jgi:hypothetical protein